MCILILHALFLMLTSISIIKNYFNSIIFNHYIQLQLAQMSADISRDELHGLSVSGGDSSSGHTSPLTARSIRLERFAQALANSQEELRR